VYLSECCNLTLYYDKRKEPIKMLSYCHDDSLVDDIAYIKKSPKKN
jgi:hypothetical protein